MRVLNDNGKEVTLHTKILVTTDTKFKIEGWNRIFSFFQFEGNGFVLFSEGSKNRFADNVFKFKEDAGIWFHEHGYKVTLCD